MKIVFLGASHWHLDLYLAPALEMPGVEVVGLHDPDLARIGPLAERLGCVGDNDFQRLCRRVKPDFAFVLGRHVDMPPTIEFLINGRIPFAAEKPCGLTRQTVAELAEMAERNGLFSAVPLVLRNGEFHAELMSRSSDSVIDYMSFRFIAGTPDRYRNSGCEWMLDPAQSGGGCTINLGVHFFDLCLSMFGPGTKVANARMSNAACGEAIEDSSLIVLEAEGRMALIETGYLLPAPNAAFDMHFSIRGDSGYVIATSPSEIEVVAPDGIVSRRSMVTTNVPLYRPFTHDVLTRAATGLAPVASLTDLVPVMGLIEDAYRLAGRPQFHPVSC